MGKVQKLNECVSHALNENNELSTIAAGLLITSLLIGTGTIFYWIITDNRKIVY